MNLKRRELIITIIAVVAVLVVALSSSVFADEDKKVTLDALKGNNNVATDLLGKDEENTKDQIQQIVTENVNGNNNNNNSATEFNKAGLEDLPVLAFVGCAVVAVFAFKKIKEYKAY